MTWLFLLNPANGLLNRATEKRVGEKLFNIYSVWGLNWVEAIVTVPLAFIIIALGRGRA
jgi:iron(III) transport system permease protein